MRLAVLILQLAVLAVLALGLERLALRMAICRALGLREAIAGNGSCLLAGWLHGLHDARHVRGRPFALTHTSIGLRTHDSGVPIMSPASDLIPALRAEPSAIRRIRTACRTIHLDPRLSSKHRI